MFCVVLIFDLCFVYCRTQLPTHSRRVIFLDNPFLEELDLSSNQISSLPYNFFSSMKNLIALNFANNNLENFPTSLSKLDKLMHLDLSGNSLKNVPENMFMNMRELRLINLSENEIKEIKNRTFVGPVFAETVALARNQLVDFPKQALAAFKYVSTT